MPLSGEDPRGPRRGTKGSCGTPGPLGLAAPQRAIAVEDEVVGARLRARSHCRFRNRGTECASESAGIKRMRGSTKRDDATEPCARQQLLHVCAGRGSSRGRGSGAGSASRAGAVLAAAGAPNAGAGTSSCWSLQLGAPSARARGLRRSGNLKFTALTQNLGQLQGSYLGIFGQTAAEGQLVNICR